MPGRTPDDRTWTHGERDTTRFHRKDILPVARLDDPDPETLRQYLEDGHCWWCERGGFKAVASHTFFAHGIPGWRLKEMAEIPKTTPICSSATSALISKNLRDQVREGIRESWADHRPTRRGGPRNMSEAGKKQSMARLLRYMESIGPDGVEEQRKRAGRARGDQLVKPHPCTACGKMMPKATPRTCSPKCRKMIRQQTARRSAEIIHARPEAEKTITREKQRVRALEREARKRNAVGR